MDNSIDIHTSDRLSVKLSLQSFAPSRGNIQVLRHSNWWKDVVVYQVWPASFKDSNGDGLGDLRGIISKLDYLKGLGVDVIWLSPMYDSPQQDMGYDISDYNKIYPPYGTMDDMDELIDGLHKRDMKIILDLVINHTSKEHRWFKESCKGRAGKYADSYIWKDAKIGKDGKREPPNNWGSIFGGSAWEWVESRQQYYLHIFATGQPDLNWARTETREMIYESALRYWLRKGVDGFRVDTCDIYSKDPLFRDGEVTPRFAPYGTPEEGIRNGPKIHEYWREIRKQVLDDFGDIFMVGELSLLTFEETLKFIGRKPRELSTVFDFSYARLGISMPHAKVSKPASAVPALYKQPMYLTQSFTLPEAKAAMKRSQDYIENPLAWATIFKENHDIPRSVNRFGTNNPKYWAPAAKLIAMLTATLSGNLFLYQGEEIGMTNIPETWSPKDLRDISSINYWNTMKSKYGDDKEMMAKVWKAICDFSRDNARTPVQWSSEKNAGFTSGHPWMRINDNYKSINVAAQQAQKDSVLSFWRQLIQLRKNHKDIFIHGHYRVHDFSNEQTWTFEKRAQGGKHGYPAAVAWVVLNFSEEEVEVELLGKHGKSVLSNMTPCSGISNLMKEKEKTRLQPFEGRVYLDL